MGNKANAKTRKGKKQGSKKGRIETNKMVESQGSTSNEFDALSQLALILAPYEKGVEQGRKQKVGRARNIETKKREDKQEEERKKGQVFKLLENPNINIRVTRDKRKRMDKEKEKKEKKLEEELDDIISHIAHLGGKTKKHHKKHSRSRTHKSFNALKKVKSNISKFISSVKKF